MLAKEQSPVVVRIGDLAMDKAGFRTNPCGAAAELAERNTEVVGVHWLRAAAAGADVVPLAPVLPKREFWRAVPERDQGAGARADDTPAEAEPIGGMSEIPAPVS